MNEVLDRIHQEMRNNTNVQICVAYSVPSEAVAGYKRIENLPDYAPTQYLTAERNWHTGAFMYNFRYKVYQNERDAHFTMQRVVRIFDPNGASRGDRRQDYVGNNFRRAAKDVGVKIYERFFQRNKDTT